MSEECSNFVNQVFQASVNVILMSGTGSYHPTESLRKIMKPKNIILDIYFVVYIV